MTDPTQAPRPQGNGGGEPPLVQLGLNLAVGMALFSVIGYRLDKRRGGGIFWTLCGTVLGLAYGAYEVWKIVRSTPGGSGK